LCHRTALAELVGKAGSFPRRGLLRIRPAEDSKSSREREKPSIRGADRVHGRGRSTSVVCQNPLGRLSSVKRLRNFASANSRACLRALRFRAYLAGFHQVWKTEGTPIRSSLVPQRFCAAQTPDFPASVRVPLQNTRRTDIAAVGHAIAQGFTHLAGLHIQDSCVN